YCTRIRCSVSACQNGADTGVASGSGVASVISVTPQYQRDLFTHDPAGAADECVVAVGDLRRGGPAHPLTRGVDHVVHAAGHSGLPEGELPARGVERKVARKGEVALVDPG